jgi:hypothetical protein
VGANHGLYRGAYGMWAEAMEQIQKYGTMVKSPTGFPIQSPYLSIANRQAEIMMRIASEFGFMPASRSRISAPPQDQLPSLVKLGRKTDGFTWRFETVADYASQVHISLERAECRPAECPLSAAQRKTYARSELFRL